jgi:hypothetical protein
MTDTDEATLAAVQQRLAEARDALDDLPPRPAVTAVLARARRRRAGRRLAAASASVTAASLAVTLAYSAQNQQPPGQAHLPAQAGGPAHARGLAPVHVHLAASWSVDTNADGTVTFRMRDTADPHRLQHALRQAGVPAQVHWGQICLAPGRHALSVKGIMTRPGGHTGPKLQSVITADGGGSKLMGISWTVSPARIPAGAHFVISAVPPGKVTAGHIQAAWQLVPGGAPVHCTSTPPARPA